MINLAAAQLWVHDQDEALEFWTKRVGMELRQDVTVPELGNFRWLSVGPAGQPDVAIVLMAVPGQPVLDDQTADEIRALTAKGFASTVFLTTDDCQAAYEELKSRGVEFRDARGAPVRRRLRLPRPVREQHPADPGQADVGRGLGE